MSAFWRCSCCRASPVCCCSRCASPPRWACSWGSISPSSWRCSSRCRTASSCMRSIALPRSSASISNVGAQRRRSARNDGTRDPQNVNGHCKDCPILRSECLHIFDQRPLIRVAQSGVTILDVAGAEVMTPADDEVGTFAELEQRLDQVGEHLFRLIVTCPSRKRLKVAPGLDHKLQHLLAMREPRCRIRAFRQRIQVGEQVHRYSGGYRTDLDAAVAEQP